MQQVLTLWQSLSIRRRMIVAGATILVFAAVLSLSRIAAQPSMSLLYAGLEPGTAGEVVAALEAQGVAYDIRGGSIFVDDARRDSLRMTLAADGLPANGALGYELLDSLSGFGTTSQMFDAAYWRAKEGELSRTIAANPRIRAARVHISNPTSNPFQRDLKPTASVAVTAAAGSIGPAQAKALKFLVASAVAGLLPEDVSIIDGQGALIATEDGSAIGGHDRAEELRRNIQRLLEARVGPGNVRVEVNVDTVTEREAITERIIDPESRIAISTDTEERTTTASGTDNDAVTVASNLPEGDAAGGESSSQSEDSETRERVNYEVSQTTREVLRAPGAIRRVSVAVLVDGIRSTDAAGTESWAPRGDAELEALRDLVASVVGFDAARGDTITLKTLEFGAVDLPDTPVSGGLLGGTQLDKTSAFQVAALALVALVLGLFVIRPILTSGGADIPALASPGPRPPSAGTEAAATEDEIPDGAPVLSGEIEDGNLPLPSTTLAEPGVDLDNLMPSPGFHYEEDPVERLRQLIQDRREETIEILRGWLDEEEPA